jgi:hypothetical protein
MFHLISNQLILLAVKEILSLSVLAQTLGDFNSTGITMGEISYGGSGCPQSSLSFIYTISDTRFGFMFDIRFGIQWIYFFHGY